MPRVAQHSDHRTYRQGDEGRSGKMHRGRCQRLHRQAVGRREAAVAGAGLDAEVVSSPQVAAKSLDIELRLLIDAIYQKYHYDFRDYALASLKRRLAFAMT